MAKPQSKQQVYIKTHGDGTVTLLIDGKDLSAKVKRASADFGAGLPVQLTVEYGCYNQMTIEGEMDVVHVCPKRARSGPDWSTTA